MHPYNFVVAIQCLSASFEIDASSDDTRDRSASAGDIDLLDLFKAKLEEKEKTLGVSCNDPRKKAQADAFKQRGNEFLLSKDYGSAIDCYTKAIELNQGDHVFYANRAAAWLHKSSSDTSSPEASLSYAHDDCEKALSLDPTYVKAQSRLASVLMAQKKYSLACEAYEKAILLDPKNPSFLEQLKEAQTMRDDGEKKVDPSQALPFDVSSLLSDPKMLSMAQNMMQSDAMKDLLKNPNIAQFAQQFLGGAASHPPSQ